MLLSFGLGRLMVSRPFFCTIIYILIKFKYFLSIAKYLPTW